jgi:exoribonuclease R
MTKDQSTARYDLRALAHDAMAQRGLLPDFAPAVLDETAKILAAAGSTPDVQDLRHLLWASIDNDDSRDLDQLSVMQQTPGGVARILVAIADVDELVKKDSAIDGHASGWRRKASSHC